MKLRNKTCLRLWQHHIYPQGIFPEKDSEGIKSSSMGDGWGLKLPLYMQRRKPFIPLFCLKNGDYFFVSESTVTLLFLSMSFVLLQKSARRSRSRDWKESTPRGWQKGGREDQAGMTCLLSGILNSCKFKKTHRNKNLWEKITNRLPQKVNLELFSITRTMTYQMSVTFLGTAEEVKYLHSTQQFTLPTTFDCQTLSVEWKNHDT